MMAFLSRLGMKGNGIPRKLGYGIVGACILFGWMLWFLSAPTSFPVGTTITIGEGANLSRVGVQLKEEGIIRSSTLFNAVAILFGGERSLVAGDYKFHGRENVAVVARRIIAGDHQIPLVKITIPEGLNTREIGAILAQNLPHINAEEFAAETEMLEGRLFPETYFFFETATSGPIIKRMQEVFDERIAEFEPEIEASGSTVDAIVTMASILEGEANNLEDRQIVAGILWRRLAIDMPLQVDAAFKYSIGKSTAELTQDDLDSDSPYNTYRNVGLPPTPISNPSAEAIYAALNPRNTSYLYFLTGRDGEMYYASTFEEHKENRELYLD